MLIEFLYSHNLVLMSKTIDGPKNKFMKWKETIDSKVLKGNLGKIKVMVSDSIIKVGLSKSKVNP